MFKKFTEGVSKVVGAGVIAAAGIAGSPQNVEAAPNDKNITEKSSPSEQMEKDVQNIQSSLNIRFSKLLAEKGFESISLRCLPSGYISIEFISNSPPKPSNVSSGTGLKLEQGNNKYFVEEEISKMVTQDLEGYADIITYTSPAVSSYNYTSPTYSGNNYTYPANTSYDYVESALVEKIEEKRTEEKAGEVSKSNNQVQNQ